MATSDRKNQIVMWVVAILFCAVQYASALDWWGTGGARPGATGATGAQGPPGAEGAQGPAGSPGADGAQGAPGPEGPPGPPGAQGIQGATGPQGIQGTQGIQGVIGPAGQDGADGSNGAPGAAGEDVEIWAGWTAEGQLLIGHSNGSAVVAPYTLPAVNGTLNQILKHNGSAELVWATDAGVGGGGDITTDAAWTAAGQLIQAHGNGTAGVIAPGAAGTVLHHTGTVAYWTTPAHYSATANVHGVSGAPASATTLATHTSGTTNMHGVTGALASATTLATHTSGTTNMHGVTGAFASATTLATHTNGTANVHGVIGDLASASSVATHVNNTIGNPHVVTAAQVGAEPANPHINDTTISIAALDLTSTTVTLPAAVNGTIATTITSVGPAGAQTTIQGWFAVVVGGVTRYIPFW